MRLISSDHYSNLLGIYSVGIFDHLLESDGVMISGVVTPTLGYGEDGYEKKVMHFYYS